LIGERELVDGTEDGLWLKRVSESDDKLILVTAHYRRWVFYWHLLRWSLWGDHELRWYHGAFRPFNNLFIERTKGFFIEKEEE